MTPKLFAFACTVLFMLIPHAAEAQVELVGSWSLESSTTKEPIETALTPRELQIALVLRGISVTRLFGSSQTTSVCALDGTESSSVDMLGQSSREKVQWIDGSLSLERRATVAVPGGTAELLIVERFEVQLDGRLKVEVTSKTAESVVTRTLIYAKVRK